MPRIHPPLWMTIVTVASCTSADSAGPTGWAEPTEIPVPAAPGAGEPFLAGGDDGPLLSWLEPAGDGAYALRLARLEGGAVGAPSTVARRDDFFVNWADFPSVAVLPDGSLAAHWLQRGTGATSYDYGVRIVRSTDGGVTWSEPWTPHEDGTPTEHGFVSLFADGPGLGAVWLDGRRFVDGPWGEASREMTLRTRSLGDAHDAGGEDAGEGGAGAGHGGGGAAASDGSVVDPRTCDCCQTDVALTARGPVVAYRDRSPEEVRDVYLARRVDGRWQEGRPVHRDGWVIAACPVNGPAVVADGERVAVAWFTAAGGTPAVQIAFSDDAGATFGAPVRLDAGNPGGRVDAALLDGGDVAVSWLERLEDGVAEIRVRRVAPDAAPGPHATVARSTDARSSGFPRMLHVGGGDLLFAWTDASAETSRVRLARLDAR